VLTVARLRSLLALALASIALAISGSAAASHGGWHYGPNWIGPGTADGPCIWYWSQAACSGWNYWHTLYTYNQQGGQILSGYENNARIRGIYINGGGSAFIFPSSVSMSGYLLAHGTYWSGGSALTQMEASA